ncbi:hypothetical protein [Sandaracinus amylolyticus]|uniref:Outer membrane protein beta-barrel domain-containing protein n=1 Tax=Sandaracinus amylolyticus TaxID=927083 RepID=A0A0F6SHB2_9BACT|nr:hypothetical protein [Sandaracinus amylolyticus]AKF10139.1 hypothetical protein DB32_007288 [Sandaracinus amylolyticus]
MIAGRIVVPALLFAVIASRPALVRAQDDDAEVLPSPTAGAPEPEPSIEELEEQMIPTLVLPELRIRVGGGVGLQTSGPVAGAEPVYGRVTEEVEWMPPALEFVSFGIGGAQMFTTGGQIYQVGARVGGHAWFCEDVVVRCQGAITLQLGAVFGSLGEWFDFSADADLRFLFVERFELFVRGSFLSFGSNSWINIVGGAAIAF